MGTLTKEIGTVPVLVTSVETLGILTNPEGGSDRADCTDSKLVSLSREEALSMELAEADDPPICSRRWTCICGTRTEAVIMSLWRWVCRWPE